MEPIKLDKNDSAYLIEGWVKLSQKLDSSNRGGDLGCSFGFNLNLYKQSLTNSFGREQMHAILEKLLPSLRQRLMILQ